MSAELVPASARADEANPLVVAREALRAATILIDTLIAKGAPAPHTAVEADPFMTVPEIAAELRRCPAYARRLCQTKAIKALRDGHGYRARRSAVLAYIRRRTA